MLVFEITLKINGFEITPLISNPNPNSNPSSQTQPIGFPAWSDSPFVWYSF